MPTATQMFKLLPDSEELIYKVHQRQLARQRARLASEKRMVQRWGMHGFRKVRMRDGTFMEFRVPRYSFLFWQQKEGPGIWNEPDFVNAFLRDNPQCRVTNEADRMTIHSGWAPNARQAAYSRKIRSMEEQPAASVPDEHVQLASRYTRLPSPVPPAGGVQ
jgi:hypothetical protein